MEATLPNMTYKGMEITLDDFHRFSIESLDQTFYTWREATEAIDGAKKAEAAQGRKKVSIPAMTDEGVDVTFTGIHYSHGKMLLTPNSDTNSILPRVGWLKDALKEQERLEGESRRIGKIIERFSIIGIRNYAYNSSPENHAREINRIKKELAAKKEEAEATDLQKQIMITPVPAEIKF